MQALLSYDQSPPIAAPFRFFLTAPVFGMLAGVLLLCSGADLLASRWTPAALALTHLITVGFMLNVMLGAMVQILPVVAGANMARPLLVSAVVHIAIAFGTLFLVMAFLTFIPYWFAVAAFFLGVGVAVFIGAAAHALYGIPPTSPTIRGLKIALFGLAVTVGLGVLLSLSFGWSLNLPLLQLADIHLGWGFVAWGVILLAAVAYVVVPMFQLTPAFPDWFGRAFSFLALGAVVAWTLADFLLPGFISSLASGVIVAVAALFAGITLSVQRQSKRPRFDATQHLWRLAMCSALLACALWFLGLAAPVVGDWTGWPLLCGVLVLFGAFMSVIIGMLYKIVPFLIWLHLQNQGQGRMMAPNMKKIIGEQAMERQMLAHFASCALLLLAVFWPEWLAAPAGVALIVSQGGLMWNLLAALSVYRGHQRKIAALSAVQPSAPN
ncbi:MAG: hypothetical protein WCK63_12925 [Betaproteobacteria bacterium]